MLLFGQLFIDFCQNFLKITDYGSGCFNILINFCGININM